MQPYEYKWYTRRSLLVGEVLLVILRQLSLSSSYLGRDRLMHPPVTKASFTARRIYDGNFRYTAFRQILIDRKPFELDGKESTDERNTFIEPGIGRILIYRQPPCQDSSGTKALIRHQKTNHRKTPSGKPREESRTSLLGPPEIQPAAFDSPD